MKHSGGWVAAAAALLALIPSLAVGQEARPPVNLTEHPADDRYPAWSPAGGALAFESNRDGNWNLFLMDPRTGNVTRLTDNPADDRFPGWDPVGRALVFFSNRDGRPAL
jgi:Tol biopolymer transport system component